MTKMITMTGWVGWCLVGWVGWWAGADTVFGGLEVVEEEEWRSGRVVGREVGGAWGR